MARFDRKKFFDGFRDRIDSTIEQDQVDGLNFLLGEMESDPFWKDLRHIAYALATIGHETAWSFQPVEEGYYLGSTARVTNFQKTLRYYPYFGRGYVQLTWKQNYEKAGEVFGVDLVDSPELALEIDISYKVLTRGMHQGWFTGKKLTDYISGSKCDYKNARRIINGTDKAALIAGYAVQFEKILTASETTGDAEIDAMIDNIGKPISADVPAVAPFDAPADDPAVHAPPTVTPLAEQPPTQIAEQIINTGDTAAAVPVAQDVVITAPPKDGATGTAAKLTIAGITVPSIVLAGIEYVKEAINGGYVTAADIGSTVIGFIRDNQKYVFLLIGLLIGLQIVKKILKGAAFLLSMLTAAIPGWNNVTVAPFVSPEPEPRWYQFWK